MRPKMSAAWRGASRRRPRSCPAVITRQQKTVERHEREPAEPSAPAPPPACGAASRASPIAAREDRHLLDPPADEAGGVFAGHHDADDDDQDRGGAVELVAVERGIQRRADAAGADDADHRGLRGN